MARPASYDAVDAVHAAPQGPHVAAFLDLDNTILAGWSVSPLVRDVAITKLLTPSFRPWVKDAVRTLREEADRGSPSSTAVLCSALTLAALALRGRREAWFSELADRIYANELAGLVYPEIRELVRLHAARGHTVVIASAASAQQTKPFALDLQIAHILSSELEVSDGRFTGTLAGEPCCGAGKCSRAIDFAGEHGIDLAESFFYTDGFEDVPLLERVGRPVATNASDELREHARERDWPELDFVRPAEQAAGPARLTPRSLLASWL